MPLISARVSFLLVAALLRLRCNNSISRSSASFLVRSWLLLCPKTQVETVSSIRSENSLLNFIYKRGMDLFSLKIGIQNDFSSFIGRILSWDGLWRMIIEPAARWFRCFVQRQTHLPRPTGNYSRQAILLHLRIRRQSINLESSCTPGSWKRALQCLFHRASPTLYHIPYHRLV